MWIFSLKNSNGLKIAFRFINETVPAINWTTLEGTNGPINGKRRINCIWFKPQNMLWKEDTPISPKTTFAINPVVNKLAIIISWVLVSILSSALFHLEWSEFGSYPTSHSEQSLLWVVFPFIQIQLFSIVSQLLAHPSPLTVFPSSQASMLATLESPQCGTHNVGFEGLFW